MKMEKKAERERGREGEVSKQVSASPPPALLYPTTLLLQNLTPPRADCFVF